MCRWASVCLLSTIQEQGLECLVIYHGALMFEVSGSNLVSASKSKSRSTVVSLLENLIGFVDLLVNVLGFEKYFNGLPAPARVSVTTGGVKFNTSTNDSRTR